MRGTHQSAPRFYNPGPSRQRCPQATWPWTGILLAEQSAVSFIPVRKRRGSVPALPPTAGHGSPTEPREATQLPSNRTTKRSENHTMEDGLQLRNQLPLSLHNNQLLPQIPPSLGASMVLSLSEWLKTCPNSHSQSRRSQSDFELLFKKKSCQDFIYSSKIFC